MTVHYERSILKRVLMFVFSVPLLIGGFVVYALIWAAESIFGGER